MGRLLMFFALLGFFCYSPAAALKEDISYFGLDYLLTNFEEESGTSLIWTLLQ